MPSFRARLIGCVLWTLASTAACDRSCERRAVDTNRATPTVQTPESDEEPNGLPITNGHPVGCAGRADQLLEVVFDQTYDQVYSPFDTGFMGLSHFAVELRRHGAHVALNSQPLSTFLPTFSGPGHVLVLGPTMYRRYNREDLDAIDGYLESGGGVLIFAEHGDLFENGTFQNAVATEHGITVLPENAEADWRDPRDRQWPICRAPRWELDDIELYLPAPLEVVPPAVALAEISYPRLARHRIVAAGDLSKSGKLIVVADVEVVWNMWPNMGIRHGDNAEFILHLLDLLVDCPLDLIEEEPSFELVPDGDSRGVVLFSKQGSSMVPDSTAHGLTALARELRERGFRVVVEGDRADFLNGTGKTRADYSSFDLVVLVAPLEPFEDLDALLEAPRLLLVGDGQSMRLNTVIEQEYNPLDAILRPSGLRMLPVSIVDSSKNHMEVSASWASNGKPLILRRGAVIAAVGDSMPHGTQTLAFADGDAWKEGNVVPMWRSDRKVQPYEPPHRSGDPLPVVVTTSRLFVVADLEPFTTPYFTTPEGRELTDRLLQWLLRGQ